MSSRILNRLRKSQRRRPEHHNDWCKPDDGIVMIISYMVRPISQSESVKEAAITAAFSYSVPKTLSPASPSPGTM